MIVRGTKIISETSFVTNIEVRNTAKTKKAVRPFMDLRRLVRFKSGLKIFSFLKPSRTVKSIKSVQRVFQSIEERRSFEGGVIKSEIRAASRETDIIMSFLKRAAVFVINVFMETNFTVCAIIFL